MNLRAALLRPWQRLARARWRHHASSSPPPIDEAGEALQTFAKQSDADFTALAQGLAHLNEQRRALRDQAAEIAGLVNADDETQALAAAYSLYKSSVDLVHASSGIAISAQGQLESIENVLVAALSQREQFDRHNMLINLIRMNIAMESSRLPTDQQNVFLNVAADLDKIRSKIHSCTDAAFERIATVVGETNTERAALHRLDQALSTEARQKIRVIQKDLDNLKATLEPCSANARMVLERFSQSGQESLKIITSLQYQDIVRQRLEHVAEGFADIQKHRGSPNQQPDWAFLRQAALVQEAQLQSARADITQASATVLGGLQSLVRSDQETIAVVLVMEQTASEALGHSQVAESFSAEINELTSIVIRSEEANRRIAQLVDRIRHVIEVFAQEIAGHEFDVKIVALNAQLAAARLPSATVLNKLGEETSVLSDVNAEQTHDLVRMLRAGLTQLQRVKSETEDFLRVLTAEKGKLERGIESVKEKLTHLVTRVRRETAVVRERFEPLCHETEKLVRGLNFPEIIETSFSPAIQLCADIAARAEQAGAAASISAQGAESLREHERRYTMHHETATHAAALTAGVAAVGTAATGVAVAVAPVADIELFDSPSEPTPAPSPMLLPDPSPAKKDDFGDGIELF